MIYLISYTWERYTPDDYWLPLSFILSKFFKILMIYILLYHSMNTTMSVYFHGMSRMKSLWPSAKVLFFGLHVVTGHWRFNWISLYFCYRYSVCLLLTVYYLTVFNNLFFFMILQTNIFKFCMYSMEFFLLYLTYDPRFQKAVILLIDRNCLLWLLLYILN